MRPRTGDAEHSRALAQGDDGIWYYHERSPRHIATYRLTAWSRVATGFNQPSHDEEASAIQERRAQRAQHRHLADADPALADAADPSR